MSTENKNTLLEVKNLKTQFSTDRGTVKAVDDINYKIRSGEVYGFVGESGAGKSVTGLSVLNLIENPGKIVDGEIWFDGENLLEQSQEELRSVRGNDITIIFQDSMTAMNPSYTIGSQIIDVILEHKDVSRKQARQRTIELLDDVQIPDAKNRVDDYPHQFSGGMRQRALIAMALACDPKLIIADEVTTALDVTTQAQILELLHDLKDKHDLAIQLITHDMGVVGEMCDKVAVMYAGKIIEKGRLSEIFERPSHPYTVGLLNSLPQSKGPGEDLESIPGNMPDLITTPSGCSFRDRCKHEKPECADISQSLIDIGGSETHSTACIREPEIEFDQGTMGDSSMVSSTSEKQYDEEEVLVEIDNLQKYFDPETQNWVDVLLGNRKYVHAVEDVSFKIYKGETLGLVGESGCGKTTLGRTVTRLYEPDDGTILFSGRDLTAMNSRDLRKERENYQVIFQDPFASLNPRRTVENIIGRPLEIHGKVSNDEEKKDRVVELLREVGLEESHLDRYPHEFSGGQKQRIGIARALAVEPDFIVADEPVSALDVSVQAKILNLLQDLQSKYDLTFLFIAHDLNVVRHISDRIAIMYLGEIVEMGTMSEVFNPPYHPYTEVLLSSIPDARPDSTRERKKPEGEIPSPINPPDGCRFHTRCPYAEAQCESGAVEQTELSANHTVKCHLFNDDMKEVMEADTDKLLEEQTTPFTEQSQSTMEHRG